ncbi:MAG: hypothetical protein ACT4QE_03865 [Anaerolineales bacterium]
MLTQTMNRTCAIAHILLLSLTLAACTPATPTPAAVVVQDGGIVASTPAGAKVNLNTASGDEFLAAIPGLGNRMVREFQEYRPYVSIQQFRKEIGKYVETTQVAEYEKYVYVPISVNDSDAATLQQIPGLSETEAVELITARPFASTEAFLTKLAGYLTTDELAIAQTYLSAP